MTCGRVLKQEAAARSREETQGNTYWEEGQAPQELGGNTPNSLFPAWAPGRRVFPFPKTGDQQEGHFGDLLSSPSPA